jgi:hypothetical protein
MKNSRKPSFDIYLDAAASIFDIGRSGTLHGEIERLSRLQEALLPSSDCPHLPSYYKIDAYAPLRNQHADLVSLCSDWQALGTYMNDAIDDCFHEDPTLTVAWEHRDVEGHRVRDCLKHEG